MNEKKIRSRSPLYEHSSINKFLKIYENNKNFKWDEWLKYNNTFKNLGKQGIVGLLQVTDEEEDDGDKIIFKMSQYIDYLINHEYTVIKGLQEISEFCPHFCKCIGLISAEVDLNYTKNTNPFKITTKYPIEKNILLMEYIKNSCKFYNYIKSLRIHDDVIFSIIKQVLLAIYMAQIHKNFSHYDLHSYNVMIKKCNEEDLFLYVIDDEIQYLIPTYGSYPVIIDYGFAYIKDMEDNALWSGMSHTDVGFMSNQYDWVADPKLFLITVSSELKEKRPSDKTINFRKMIKTIFKPLTIDSDSGWDKLYKYSASEYLIKYLRPIRSHKSIIFSEYECYSMELIQSLIILPLEKRSYKGLKISYNAFVNEFIKIENLISNPYKNLYILKCIIDITREIRHIYINNNTRNEGIKYFRQSLHYRINKISAWFNPKNINYELMLCSLLELSQNMEGYLHYILTDINHTKNLEYKNLPISNTKEIIDMVEIFSPSDFTIKESSKIFVFNSKNKSTFSFSLDYDDINKINKIHPIDRGNYIYKNYNLQ